MPGAAIWTPPPKDFTSNSVSSRSASGSLSLAARSGDGSQPPAQLQGSPQPRNDASSPSIGAESARGRCGQASHPQSGSSFSMADGQESPRRVRYNVTIILGWE